MAHRWHLCCRRETRWCSVALTLSDSHCVACGACRFSSDRGIRSGRGAGVGSYPRLSKPEVVQDFGAEQPVPAGARQEPDVLQFHGRHLAPDLALPSSSPLGYPSFALDSGARHRSRPRPRCHQSGRPGPSAEDEGEIASVVLGQLDEAEKRKVLDHDVYSSARRVMSRHALDVTRRPR